MDTQSKMKKKKQRAKRELTGDWPDDKIRELIHNVQIRPELWDVGSTNYRVSKPQSWQEIAMHLGKGYDWRDCRLKWQNLRVTYKCNLLKIAKKQTDTGTTCLPRILWRFFHLMKFLTWKGNGNGQQHNLSDCNSNLNEKDNPLNLDTEITTASSISQNVEISQCSSNSIKEESFEPEQSLVSPPTPTPQQHFNVRTLMKTSAPTHNEIPSEISMNDNDEHACFGNFIAAELRSLPAERAFALKRRLNRTILEYWDEIAMEQTTVQNVAVTKKEVDEIESTNY